MRIIDSQVSAPIYGKSVAGTAPAIDLTYEQINQLEKQATSIYNRYAQRTALALTELNKIKALKVEADKLEIEAKPSLMLTP